MVNALLLLLATTTGIQDPTQPLRTAPTLSAAASPQVETVTPTLQLQAVFTGGHDSAIIDGKRYQVGDKVQNYRLLRINSSQVMLQEGQGRALTLTLFPSLSTPSNR